MVLSFILGALGLAFFAAAMAYMDLVVGNSWQRGDVAGSLFFFFTLIILSLGMILASILKYRSYRQERRFRH